jgi:hypothetical protein
MVLSGAQHSWTSLSLSMLWLARVRDEGGIHLKSTICDGTRGARAAFS